MAAASFINTKAALVYCFLFKIVSWCHHCNWSNCFLVFDFFHNFCTPRFIAMDMAAACFINNLHSFRCHHTFGPMPLHPELCNFPEHFNALEQQMPWQPLAYANSGVLPWLIVFSCFFAFVSTTSRCHLSLQWMTATSFIFLDVRSNATFWSFYCFLVDCFSFLVFPFSHKFWTPPFIAKGCRMVYKQFTQRTVLQKPPLIALVCHAPSGLIVLFPIISIWVMSPCTSGCSFWKAWQQCFWCFWMQPCIAPTSSRNKGGWWHLSLQCQQCAHWREKLLAAQCQLLPHSSFNPAMQLPGWLFYFPFYSFLFGLVTQ